MDMVNKNWIIITKQRPAWCGPWCTTNLKNDERYAACRHTKPTAWWPTILAGKAEDSRDRRWHHSYVCLCDVSDTLLIEHGDHNLVCYVLNISHLSICKGTKATCAMNLNAVYLLRGSQEIVTERTKIRILPNLCMSEDLKYYTKKSSFHLI